MPSVLRSPRGPPKRYCTEFFFEEHSLQPDQMGLLILTPKETAWRNKGQGLVSTGFLAVLWEASLWFPSWAGKECRPGSGQLGREHRSPGPQGWCNWGVLRMMPVR